MRVYLASTGNAKKHSANIKDCKYILESFYYISEWQTKYINDYFLLDSGAFTFMNNNKGSTDWDLYVTKYARFINNHKIKLFFELDIDSIVGLREVERLRNKLERLTGKKCIPVWHKNRGKEYFIRMVETYDYVAIGGIVTKEIKRKEYKHLKWFIRIAHANNCKIHGLGFTPLKELHKYDFDSVDSSSWASAGRYGTVYVFDGKSMSGNKVKGKRLRNRRKADRHNFEQWIKFQRFAEKNY